LRIRVAGGAALRQVVDQDVEDPLGAAEVLRGEAEVELGLPALRGSVAICTSDGERLPLRLKKSSKNSSNGAPFGTFGSGAPSAPFRFWLVEILTTASMSFSAIGATLAGPPFVCVAAGADNSTSALEASTAASAAARDRAWRAADFTATRIVSGVCGCAGPLMACLLPLH